MCEIGDKMIGIVMEQMQCDQTTAKAVVEQINFVITSEILEPLYKKQGVVLDMLQILKRKEEIKSKKMCELEKKLKEPVKPKTSRNCLDGYLTEQCSRCPDWADGTDGRGIGCACHFPIMECPHFSKMYNEREGN